MAPQNTTKRQTEQLDMTMTQMRRNPYLAKYGARRPSGQRSVRKTGSTGQFRGTIPERKIRRYDEGSVPGQSRRMTADSTRSRKTTATTVSERQQHQNRSAQLTPSAKSQNPHPQRPQTARTASLAGLHPQRSQTARTASASLPYADNTYATREQHRHARAERARRRRQARIRRNIRMTILCAGIAVMLIFLRGMLHTPASSVEASTPAELPAVSTQPIAEPEETKIQGLPATVYAAHPDWTEDFLTISDYTRPGDPLPEVKNIFVHYTANPGTSAAQNRSYFEQLKDNHERSASAHFIIGYNGEIIQCVPLDEVAYAVQTRNEDSISIECCYKADNGQFTQETYDSLIRLLKWLTDAYDLEPDDILRHYDCGGKKCPLYYTEHEDAWEQLKNDVKNL